MMLQISILLIITIAGFLSLKRIFTKNLALQQEGFQALSLSYDTLVDKFKALQKDSGAQHNTLSRTVALYELTKQVCSSLDAQSIFSTFRLMLGRFIEVDDCRLLGPQVHRGGLSAYTIYPIQIEGQTVSDLAVQGLRPEQREDFLILFNQFMLGAKRAFLYQRIQELVITDSLTGAFTRSYYNQRLEEELERSRKFGYSFSYLMVDVDRFKEHNDHYGHLIGDYVLKEVAGIIKDKIRQIDSLGRYGGDEFLVILPETDKKGALFAAERIRGAVEDRSIRAYDEVLKVTVSIGVATFPDHANDNASLIDNADNALYLAKEAGRNRIRYFNNPL